jgi:hypothetical protein
MQLSPLLPFFFDLLHWIALLHRTLTVFSNVLASQ